MFNKINNQEVFISSDLSLVSAILATKKAKLVSASKITPYKFEFQLTPLLPCLELENEYINDKLIISAKAISDNVRLLKSLIKQDSITNNQYGNNRQV
ncbi:MAG: hypothetical protein WA152_02955 [Microgenomates group bacterium]|jgi:hypothetical protein